MTTSQLIWDMKLVRKLKLFSLFQRQMGNNPAVLGSSAPLLKVLSFDLIHLLQSSVSIFNNNAKACYNRIVDHFSQLCRQKLGLPSEAAYFILHFLSVTQYYIKTLHGVSSKFYSNLVSTANNI